MAQARFLFVFALPLVALAGAFPSPPAVDAQPPGMPRPGWPQRLTLAILPYQVPPHIYDMWTPVADHLSDKLGMFVRVTTTTAYEDYVREVLVQRPELAYFNSLQYLTAHRDGGYDALVAPNQKMVGRLVVRVDSPIRTLGDLRGRSIALLPSSAMPGHLQPKALLLDHGLVAGRDYSVVEVANHDLSINAVVTRRVHAGATGVAAFETLPAATKAELRIVAETPPQPPVVIAARRDVDPSLREAVARALLSLGDEPRGREILRPLGWDRLVRATDADYHPTREFARKLGLTY